MMRNLVVALMAVGFAAFSTSAALADSDYEYGKQMPALIKAFPQAKVPLAQGIKDAEQGGKAISSQYEVDPDDGFQLSVFVNKGAEVDEVIVNNVTGAIKSSDKLTDPDDIKDSKNQLAAMAKAKKTLADVVAAAVQANPGYAAIRVVPKLGDDGKAVAFITLLKGSATKKLTASLE